MVEISNAIKQIVVLDDKVKASLFAIIQSFIEQAGGADISSYAPGRINAWNGPEADLRYQGDFFKPAKWWCPELHEFCERLMPRYHACLVTYSGKDKNGRGIALHGDQSYAAFRARSINLQADSTATTAWFYGQQYPGMAYSKQQQTIARWRKEFEADSGQSFYHFELVDGAVIEFNCKNPHAAHPGPDRYSINLWQANQKNGAEAVWRTLTEHDRSGGGRVIETGIEPVLPPALNWTPTELEQIRSPEIIGMIRPRAYYLTYMNLKSASPGQPRIESFFSETGIQHDVCRAPALIQQGYKIVIKAVRSHNITRSDRFIISGGQDGADQGGLIAAAKLGLPTGGIAPHGWLVSTGTAQELLQGYGLIEGPPASSVRGTYRIRTILNAAQADATIIFGSVDPEKDRGSYLTLQLARWYAETKNMAWCYVTIEDLLPHNQADTASVIRAWLESEDVKILNVAGNRQKKIQQYELDQAVAECLTTALS